jgi:hypothetical protein
MTQIPIETDIEKKDFLDNIDVMIGEMNTILGQALPRTDVKQDTCINYMATDLKRCLKLLKKVISHEIR